MMRWCSIQPAFLETSFEIKVKLKNKKKCQKLINMEETIFKENVRITRNKLIFNKNHFVSPEKNLIEALKIIVTLKDDIFSDICSIWCPCQIIEKYLME